RRVGGDIGNIELQPGDLLLIEALPTFDIRYKYRKDFFLVRGLEDSSAPRHERTVLSFLILISMVLAASLGLLTMLQSALLAAVAMIFSRCCSVADARESIDWSVLIVIASALGFGEALQQSGTANILAQGVLGLLGVHPWLL